MDEPVPAMNPAYDDAVRKIRETGKDDGYLLYIRCIAHLALLYGRYCALGV